VTGHRPLSADPLVRALAAAIREIAERRAAEAADRRRTIRVVDQERRTAA
jgi:hypothetical protein